jgi:hypothetical protein
MNNFKIKRLFQKGQKLSLYIQPSLTKPVLLKSSKITPEIKNSSLCTFGQ